jgi:hypothetical protein
MQSDQISLINKNINLEIKAFMVIAIMMEVNSKLKENLSKVIIIKIKMKMINKATVKMKKIISMIISTRITMNKINTIIRNTANTILTNNKINKESLKRLGINICTNSKKNNVVSIKTKRKILNK